MKNTFKTKQEAVEFTEGFIKKLTPKKAHEIVTPDYDLEKLRQYTWNLGIGGWYFNSENTLFCNEVLNTHILSYALIHITRKNK